jgi:outer membrane protein OmpA-like peptidoglycan-associated protein
MKRYFTALCFVLVSLAGNSQSKKLWLAAADDAYKKNDYAAAVYYYTHALDDSVILSKPVLPYEPTLANLPMKELTDTTHNILSDGKVVTVSKYDYIVHQLGHAYQLNSDYDDAVAWLKKSIDRGVYLEDEYYHAVALMQKKRYTEAMNEFESYSGSSYKTDSLARQAQRMMASCFFAKDSINNYHKQVRVHMMDTTIINKGSANFAPMFFGGTNKLMFTSARKGGVVNNPDKQDSKYLCDLWWTEQQDGVWSKPVNFGRPVNSGLHEGAGVMSADEILFLTRWSDNNHNEAFIYMAKMADGKFFECLKLDNNVNMAGYKAMHPFISHDGSRLYFSSNRPGGYGGMDIWYVNIDENGATSEPHNAGKNVNTNGNEVTPFFHNMSSTLFFASDNLPGLGGLDVYKSSYNPDDTSFAKPKNMGQPVNSSKDDAYFIMERTQTKGYFASDREDCVGGHCYDIYEFDNEPIEFTVRGTVFDAMTNMPIPGALVTIRDVHHNAEPITLTTDERGNYFTKLNPDMEFFFKAQKNKYTADASSYATKGKTETTHKTGFDFFLNLLPGGDVVIEGVEYENDKAALKPRSKEMLDNIYNMLKLNENISIEIGVHADDANGAKLTQARAQSCVDYLASKGISKDRLIAKGYGKSKPLMTDAEIAKLPKSEQAAAHRNNSRTAFKIISETDIKSQSKS